MAQLGQGRTRIGPGEGMEGLAKGLDRAWVGLGYGMEGLARKDTVLHCEGMGGRGRASLGHGGPPSPGMPSHALTKPFQALLKPAALDVP